MVAVGPVDIEVFKLRGRGQDDIGVVHGIGGELLVDDGEQVVAHQAGDHLALVGADGGGVAIVDVQGANGRAGQLAGQGFGQLVHVDRPGAGWRQVEAGQSITGEVERAAGREQGPSAVVPPGADDRGQAGDRPDRHPPSEVALEAVVDPDQARGFGCIAPGQFLDRLGVNPGDRRDPVDRIFFQGSAPESIRPDGRSVEIILIDQAVAPEDVHQAQGERRVGPGAGLDVPVGPSGGRASERVDRHQRRARFPGLNHPAPEVAVGVRGVGTPVDDQLATAHRHRVGPQPPPAHRVFVAQRPRRGADGPVELRSSEPMEESSVEAARLKLPHRPVIAIRQNRLRPVG